MEISGLAHCQEFLLFLQFSVSDSLPEHKLMNFSSSFYDFVFFHSKNERSDQNHIQIYSHRRPSHYHFSLQQAHTDIAASQSANAPPTQYRENPTKIKQFTNKKCVNKFMSTVFLEVDSMKFSKSSTISIELFYLRATPTHLKVQRK